MRNVIKLQCGATLIELLVSVVIGLIITASMLGMYVTSTANSSQLLKSSKLNQELTTLMNVMANDIRRAGYRKYSTGNDININPFSSEVTDEETVLSVFNNLDVIQSFQGNGVCILYSYDSGPATAGDGVVDDDEIRGFRLKNGVVEILRKADTPAHENSCYDDNDEWFALTDDENIIIETLKFDLVNSGCLNTDVNPDEPNGEDDDSNGTVDDEGNPDCFLYLTDASVSPPSSGDLTVITRQVDITLGGYLASDPSVRFLTEQQTRVRNDWLRVHP